MLVASVFFFYAFPLSDYLRSPQDQDNQSRTPTRQRDRHQHQHGGGGDFHRLNNAEDESGLGLGAQGPVLSSKVRQTRGEGREERGERREERRPLFLQEHDTGFFVVLTLFVLFFVFSWCYCTTVLLCYCTTVGHVFLDA